MPATEPGHERRRSRPQYHYLYGSTEVSESGAPSTPSTTIGSPPGADDSLLGEGLVLTDAEDDNLTPNTSEQDLQQVVVTNGTNGAAPLQLPAAYDAVANETSNLLAGPVPPPPPPTIKQSPKPAAWCFRCLCAGDHPIGRVTSVVLVMAVAICMCTLVMVLSSDGGENALGGPASGYRSGPRFDYIPFPVVDREEYNDPATSIVDPNLFDPVLLFKGTAASARTNRTVDPLLKVPFPTGAFWTNLVVSPTSDKGLSFPIVAYPYAFKWSKTLLQASYPPLRRKVDKISIRDTFNPDITFSTIEKVVKRHIMAFDSLSVTARFFVDSGGFWESYMVMGSPYITIKYQDSTPNLRALSTFSDVTCPFDSQGQYKDGSGFDSKRRRTAAYKWGVCTPYDPLSSNDGGEGLAISHGVQFLLQTKEGLTWMLFASEPIALVFDTIHRTTVTAAEKYSGVLRLALIPPVPADGAGPLNGSAPLSNSSGLRRLIYHSHVYPVSGSVSWDFRRDMAQTPTILTPAKRVIGLGASISGNGKTLSTLGKRPTNRIATLKFNFQMKSMNQDAGSGGTGDETDLLMLSLPHHTKSLSQDAMLTSTKFDLVYQCIKGSMTPVVGDTWSQDVMLSSFGFDDADIDGYAEKLNPGVRDLIMTNVEKDMNIVLPTLDENVYGFGKQIARLAQLTHIMSVMDYATHIQPKHPSENSPHTKSGSSASRSLSGGISKLHSFLVDFLDGNATDQLVYDAKFGGIVSQDGLIDKEADFGNGRYNDHHFHYGYILYACAILGKMNSTFVSEYGDHVDALMFDIAHNGNGDSLSLDSVFFPLARHKSWYDGHSFATGLFPFGNGKSQESSSEAVNAYYGAYLWSLVREGSQDDPLFELTDFARLLLAMEIQGARAYWHMIPPSDMSRKTASTRPIVYNPSFEKNYMVGNLGMLDVVCSTWFGTKSLYVHMINFMPVTAITSLLFNKTYAEIEFDAVLAPILANVDMAWRGYVVADQAIVSPSAAWTEAQNLQSNQLDSALSKSQVLYWISTRPGFNATVTSSAKMSSSATLNSNTSSSSRPVGKSSNSQSTRCEDNKECAKLGLTGFCCPSSGGDFLGCCSSKR